MPRSRDWPKIFPILTRTTYLASHTLGAMPAATAEALKEYHDAWDRLGVEAWAGPWWQSLLGFCAAIEDILRAPPGTVVPVQNATRGMAGVASCLDYRGPRRKVVMSNIEFTTAYPFWRAQERLGAELVVVNSPDGMTVPAQALAEAVDETTLLVATCHAFFRSGGLQDLKDVVGAAHDAGAWVLGDGYHAAGTLPVDVQALGVDFYVGGCIKYLCGGPGAGFLYVRKELQDELEPTLTGWFGMKDPFSFPSDTRNFEMNPGVFKFLDGTPNVPAFYSSREGLKIIREVGVAHIRKHSLELTQRAIVKADELGLSVRTPRSPSERSGMVCLDFAGAKEAADALIKKRIIVDWRPGCGIRIAPHFYNTAEDVDRFFEALGTELRTTVKTARKRESSSR